MAKLNLYILCCGVEMYWKWGARKQGFGKWERKYKMADFRDNKIIIKINVAVCIFWGAFLETISKQVPKVFRIKTPSLSNQLTKQLTNLTNPENLNDFMNILLTATIISKDPQRTPQPCTKIYFHKNICLAAGCYSWNDAIDFCSQGLLSQNILCKSLHFVF